MKLLETVTAFPLKAGTRAPRKREATQPPTEVPPNLPPTTLAVVTRPLGANVTMALPLPVGPPGILQPAALPAADDSAEIAADLLNGGAPESPAGAAGLETAFGVVPVLDSVVLAVPDFVP